MNRMWQAKPLTLLFLYIRCWLCCLFCTCNNQSVYACFVCWRVNFILKSGKSFQYTCTIKSHGMNNIHTHIEIYRERYRIPWEDCLCVACHREYNLRFYHFCCHCYHMLMNQHQHASDNNGSLDDWNAHFSFTHTLTHNHNRIFNREIFFFLHFNFIMLGHFFFIQKGIFLAVVRSSDSQARMTQYAYIHFTRLASIQSSLRSTNKYASRQSVTF